MEGKLDIFDENRIDTIQDSVLKLQEREEKIYLKYYFTDEVIEEMKDNLPNDLLIRINYDYSVENILGLMGYVDEALRKRGKKTDSAQIPFSFNFSIINKWVVEKEKVFNQEYNIDNRCCMSYRPYFMEYKGYCSNEQQFEALLKLIVSEKNNYYSGFFFTNANEQIEGQFREGWIHGHKIIAILRGELLVSASPIEMISGQLCIIEDKENISPEYGAVLDDSIYKCNSDPITRAQKCGMKSSLDKTLLNKTPNKLNLYNVGQGNCASVEMDNGEYIFIDIGMTRDKIELSNAYTKKARISIRKINPKVVILSHWDLDHILGITNASDSIYDAVWIVPDLWGLMKYTKKKKDGQIDYSYISESAKRLLKYLDWKNRENLFILDDSLSKSELFTNPTETISLWSGKRVGKSGYNKNKQHYNITPANNFGIMVYLRNNFSALLPGDCEYQVIPDGLKKKEINYLVVPHHCSKMSEPNIKPASDIKIAVLSYGIHNNHHHPDMLHMQQLYEKGFEILPTIGLDIIECDL